MESIPAGWYPDPQGLADERYHDGSEWTTQTRQSAAKSGQAQVRSTSGNGLKIFRTIALFVMLVLALIVGVQALTGKPNEYTVNDSAALISAALSDYEANNDLAESAPQQQVVNGWIARDLLSINARQNVAMLTVQTELAALQSRTNQLLSGLVALLFLLIGGVAVIGATVIGRGNRGN